MFGPLPPAAVRLEEVSLAPLAFDPRSSGRHHAFGPGAVRRPGNAVCVRRARQDRDDAGDDVLLDPHPLSPERATDTVLDGISENGSRIVYAIRRGGEDETELHVLIAAVLTATLRRRRRTVV
jgi:hypothetical protein